MKKFTPKCMCLMLTAVLFTALFGTTVYAHALLSREVEPGIIQFFFDDDTYMVGGHVTVFDMSGAVIATGLTDDQGFFDFSEFEDVGSVSAQDLAGHHRVHDLGGENIVTDTMARAVIAVPAVIFASSVVYYFSVGKAAKGKRREAEQVASNE